MKHSIYITMILIAVTACSGVFVAWHLWHKEDTAIPKVEITQGADSSLNVRVSLARIKKEIAPIVIEEFLSRIKITSSEKGLRLADFKEDSVLARYGFRRGDIVKEIDGQKVKTAEDALRICEALEDRLLRDRSAKEIKVALNRNDQDIDINFKIPEFVPEKVSYALRLEKRGRR